MTTTVTSTIKPSGGDYTTITAWEAAKQGNLVTADQVQIAECYTFTGGLSDMPVISGSTTDSTRYMKVTVASGNRHGGIPKGGFYLTNSTSDSYGFQANDGYCKVEYVDIYLTSSFSGGFYSSSATAVLSNCISNATSDRNGFYLASSCKLYCCLAYSAPNGFRSNTDQNPSLFNCVAANCSSNGFIFTNAFSTMILKNCIAYSCGTNYNVNGGSWNAACTNNATSTGSDDAPGSNSVISVASSNFVNAASNNFHLATGTNSLVGAGVDLTASFTLDIDGETWPNGSAWDIGFDYRVSAGGGSFQPAWAVNSNTMIQGALR